MGGGVTPVFARHGILPRNGTSTSKSLTVLIFCEFRESVQMCVLEHTISSRVVSHAISDLAGRYANCIPSFGGFGKIRVYVRAATFSRGIYI